MICPTDVVALILINGAAAFFHRFEHYSLMYLTLIGALYYLHAFACSPTSSTFETATVQLFALCRAFQLYDQKMNLLPYFLVPVLDKREYTKPALPHRALIHLLTAAFWCLICDLSMHLIRHTDYNNNIGFVGAIYSIDACMHEIFWLVEKLKQNIDICGRLINAIIVLSQFWCLVKQSLSNISIILFWRRLSTTFGPNGGI